MIEVTVFDTTNDNCIQYLKLNECTTLQVLITQILQKDINALKVGIYGKFKEPTYTLNDKDRVEFYEKIVANPKIKRKNRAESK